MKELPIFLEYKDETYFMQLLKEKHHNGMDMPSHVGDSLFTLRHNLATEKPLQGLTYVEAMVLWVGLIAEIVEIHTDESNHYPYTKEQFTAMVNCYTQADSPILSDVLATSLSKETSNLGL